VAKNVKEGLLIQKATSLAGGVTQHESQSKREKKKKMKKRKVDAQGVSQRGWRRKGLGKERWEDDTHGDHYKWGDTQCRGVCAKRTGGTLGGMPHGEMS